MWYLIKINFRARVSRHLLIWFYSINLVIQKVRRRNRIFRFSAVLFTFSPNRKQQAIYISTTLPQKNLFPRKLHQRLQKVVISIYNRKFMFRVVVGRRTFLQQLIFFLIPIAPLRSKRSQKAQRRLQKMCIRDRNKPVLKSSDG